MSTIAETLNAGLAHHQAGRLKEAGDLYRRVLTQQPDNAHALHLLGVVAHQTGNNETAVDLISKAIAKRADIPAYYSNLGIALRDLDQPAEAEQAHRQALSLNSEYAEAWNNLGVALTDQQRSEEAELAHREAVRLQPDYADAWNNLGIALMSLAQPADAEKAHRKALRLRPEYPDAWLNLTAVLKAQNRIDEAEAAVRQALQLDPDNAQALLYLASAKTFESTDDEDAVQIQALLERANLPAEDAAKLQFALGKIHDDCCQWGQAFSHFHTANRISGKSRLFDANKHAELVSNTISVFSKHFLAERQSFGSDSESPVFIVGLSRAGKSLVEQIVAAHPQVHGAGELLMLPHRIIDALTSRPEASGSYPDCARDLDEALALELAEQYETGSRRNCDVAVRRVCDTLHTNFLQLGFIQLLFPRARVIHCQRDRLDNCLAIYFKTYRRGNAHSHSFADIGAYYRQYERIMQHWHQVLSLEMLEVRYEDMTANPAAAARQLIRFLGLDWDDQCLAFQENRGACNASSEPMHTRWVGHSRHYSDFLEPLRHALNITDNTTRDDA